MRRLEFPAEWTEEVLEQYYKQAQTPMAARRYQALLLCAKSIQRQEVAVIVGVSRRTLQNWIHQALRYGLDSLKTQKGGRGRRSKLNWDQQATLDQWVTDSPTITLRTLQQRIKKEWGIELSQVQIYHLLKKLEYRQVTPQKRHYQAPVEDQEAFKKKFPSGPTRLREVATTYSSAMRPGGV